MPVHLTEGRLVYKEKQYANVAKQNVKVKCRRIKARVFFVCLFVLLHA